MFSILDLDNCRFCRRFVRILSVEHNPARFNQTVINTAGFNPKNVPG